MRFKPEPDSPSLEGIPGAEPGTYTMSIIRWRENVTTKYGERDCIDFTGDNDQGVTVGATLWISGPRTGDDGKHRKGNLWHYKRLAEALGPDAVEAYETVDPAGFSTFRPTDFRSDAKGQLRFVTVVINGRGDVEEVTSADPVVVAALNASPSNPLPEVGDPHNLDDGRHDTGSNDDIPF
jgi:hypothetical protein